MPAGEAPSAKAALLGPLGQSVVGPYAGKKSLAFGAGNTFNVGEGQEVRLVDAAGNVIFSGSGVEGANQAVAAAQSLSDELGGAANFKIQTGERTINPDGSVGAARYIDVARAAPSQSGLGFLADTVLPFAATFIPGVGPVLGAALGSAASSAAQGRSVEDALKRAAIAGGTAYLGGQVFGPASSGTPAATGGGAVAASAPAGAGSAIGATTGDIVVNAAPSLLGSTLGGVVGSAVPSVIAQPSTPDEIVVTGKQQPEINLGGVLGSAVSPVSAPPPTLDEIVVTGAKPVQNTDTGIPGLNISIPEGIPGALTAAQTSGTPPKDKFNLMDILDYATLISAGLGALGGGGGAGETTPYTSPFGAGIGFGTGQDMRVNPNIIDYERYGFGPEALFFAPGYGRTGSAATPAPAPQAAPIMATNPVYQPLI